MTTQLNEFDWLAPFRDQLPPTPFYLYSESRLEELWKAFSAPLSQADLPIRLHFPVKTNHNPHVLHFFQEKGCGVDVVSGYELEFSIKNGFKGEDIIFSSSGKSDAELKLALKHDIKMICVESRSELLRLRQLCVDQNTRARISFRVNPNVDAQTHPYISTGLYDHKFGIGLEDAATLYQEASKFSEIELMGVSTHIGSQITKVSIFKETLDQLLKFVRQLRTQGVPLRILDLGGGLGINYNQPLQLPQFQAYAEVLLEAAQEWKILSEGRGHIITECGRALCAQAGVIVTRLIATKKTPHKNFAIVDVSMTELMRPCLYQSEHLFERVMPQKDNELIDWQIAGPVCETTDVLIKSYKAGELKNGELFLVQQTGAYGYVMAHHYNLRPLPAEWWIDRKGTPQISRPQRPFF